MQLIASLRWFSRRIINSRCGLYTIELSERKNEKNKRDKDKNRRIECIFMEKTVEFKTLVFQCRFQVSQLLPQTIIKHHIVYTSFFIP